jgi:hypothetical protein
MQDKYSAEALSTLQQEVSGLRDRLKLLTAKQARLEAISKRSVQAKVGHQKPINPSYAHTYTQQAMLRACSHHASPFLFCHQSDP